MDAMRWDASTFAERIIIAFLKYRFVILLVVTCIFHETLIISPYTCNEGHWKPTNCGKSFGPNYGKIRSWFWLKRRSKPDTTWKLQLTYSVAHQIRSDQIRLLSWAVTHDTKIHPSCSTLVSWTFLMTSLVNKLKRSYIICFFLFVFSVFCLLIRLSFVITRDPWSIDDDYYVISKLKHSLNNKKLFF